MAKILITDPIHEAGIEELKKSGNEIRESSLTPEQLLEEVRDYEVLIVRGATKVTKEVIGAGKNLKVIARSGAGLDNIDLEAARKRGIKVVSCPEAETEAVTELMFGLMLSWARHLPQADASMKRGKWEKKKLLGTELCGKTLGIIGTGRIGRAVGYRARAFAMRLLAYDIVQNLEFAKRTGAKYVELDKLLSESDFITLHVPLTPETERMIGERELNLMKPSAILINTSRGKVVDESALVDALKKNKIAGACLDVYGQDPPTGSPLLKLNVILTPHIGASTAEAQRDASLIIARKIKEILAQ